MIHIPIAHILFHFFLSKGKKRKTFNDFNLMKKVSAALTEKVRVKFVGSYYQCP